jgi:hypothetical protein
MDLPSLDGSNLHNGYIAKMPRLLYGIPSAGRVWERYLDQFLRGSLSVRPLVGDRSLYKILFYRGQDGLLTTEKPSDEQCGGEGGSREPDAFVIAGTFGYLTGSTRVLEDNQAACLQAGGDHPGEAPLHTANTRVASKWVTNDKGRATAAEFARRQKEKCRQNWLPLNQLGGGDSR